MTGSNSAQSKTYGDGRTLFRVFVRLFAGAASTGERETGAGA